MVKRRSEIERGLCTLCWRVEKCVEETKGCAFGARNGVKGCRWIFDEAEKEGHRRPKGIVYKDGVPVGVKYDNKLSV